MPRVCTICRHEKRAEIDEALVGQHVSLRGLATRYGLSDTSVWRHGLAHIPAILAEAQQAELESDADTLLEKVGQLEAMARTWHDEATALLAAAKAREDGAPDAIQTGIDKAGEGRRLTIKIDDPLRTRAAAIVVGTRAVRTVGHALELLGRVTGELRERREVTLTLDPALATRLGRLDEPKRLKALDAFAAVIELVETEEAWSLPHASSG